jgi:hypothetical protein
MKMTVRAVFCCVLLASCVDDPTVQPGDSDDTELIEAPACAIAADCDDGDPCNGEESCDAAGACAVGEAVVCEADRVCAAEAGLSVCVCGPGLVEVEGACVQACGVPYAPVLGELAQWETLTFQGEGEIEVAVTAADAPAEAFEATREVSLAGWLGAVRVAARTVPDGCAAGPWFEHIYQVAPAYSGGASAVDSVAVGRLDPGVVGWASEVVSYEAGAEVDAQWQDTAAALGPAEGTMQDVVSLGRGGSITLGFEAPLADGPGPELAVFENGFADVFLELAYVEVSSDGETFARFDTAALTPEPLGAFGTLDPTTLTGFAGKYRQGFGVPFDLAWLRWQPEVLSGQVDLSRVRQVRIVDLLGDGAAVDSFGRTVYDPYPTVQSAGFDLDAVAVLAVQP